MALVGEMQVKNFYVPVGVVLQKFDGVFAADVDVHAATLWSGSV